MVFSFLFVFYAAFFWMCVEPCFFTAVLFGVDSLGVITSFASCFCDRLFAAGKGISTKRITTQFMIICCLNYDKDRYKYRYKIEKISNVRNVSNFCLVGIGIIAVL